MLNKSYYSASELLKRSCRQIVWLRNKKERILSKRMISGISYQDRV